MIPWWETAGIGLTKGDSSPTWSSSYGVISNISYNIIIFKLFVHKLSSKKVSVLYHQQIMRLTKSPYHICCDKCIIYYCYRGIEIFVQYLYVDTLLSFIFDLSSEITKWRHFLKRWALAEMRQQEYQQMKGRVSNFFMRVKQKNCHQFLPTFGAF